MTQQGSDPLILHRLNEADKKMEDMTAEIKAMRAEMATLKNDAEKRERARLKWGIGVLGTVVMYLVVRIAPPLESILFRGPDP